MVRIRYREKPIAIIISLIVIIALSYFSFQYRIILTTNNHIPYFNPNLPLVEYMEIAGIVIILLVGIMVIPVKGRLPVQIGSGWGAHETDAAAGQDGPSPEKNTHRPLKILIILLIAIALICAAVLSLTLSAPHAPGELIQSFLPYSANFILLITGLISFAAALICLFLYMDSNPAAAGAVEPSQKKKIP